MSSRRIELIALLALLALVGVLIRVAPLASDRRVFASVTEDGYLMLTVARNIALGLGLTTAAGTMPTNGVQPAVTMVWAGVHAVFGPDRLPVLRAVVVLQAVAAGLAAVCVWAVARRLLAPHPWREYVAAAAAVLWFAGPVPVRHTTNGLETGIYALTIAVALLVDRRWTNRTLARAVTLGALLGLVFLVRNDAVFFIAAWTAVELWPEGDAQPTRRLRSRIGHAAVACATALVVASPWIAWNAWRFGHVIPTSGRAQSLESPLAESLPALPRVVAEYVLLAVPLPAGMDAYAPARWVVALALVGAAMATWKRRVRLGLRGDRALAILVLFSASLAIYYGLFFGAPHFLSRYLLPASLLTAIVAAAWWGDLVLRVRWVAIAPIAALVGALLVAHARAYERGSTHPHMQVVDWVAAHVAAATWVGAPQSGTLGYFHERTVNLDGKVNPAALEARRDKRLFRYIVFETPIEYVADWMGLTRWVEQPASVREEEQKDLLAETFDLIVRDSARNLAVLRRRPGLARASER